MLGLVFLLSWPLFFFFFPGGLAGVGDEERRGEERERERERGWMALLTSGCLG